MLRPKAANIANANMVKIIEDWEKKGVEIRKINLRDVSDAKYSVLHSKIIIIDSSYSIIGSNNWTESALTENREVAVFIRSRNAILLLKKKFNNLWNNEYAVLGYGDHLFDALVAFGEQTDIKVVAL